MYTTVEIKHKGQLITLEVAGHMDSWEVLTAYINDDEQTDLSSKVIEEICSKYSSNITEAVSVAAEEYGEWQAERDFDKQQDDYRDEMESYNE